MEDNSKPKSNAKLKNLPAEEQAEIYALFTETAERPAKSLDEVAAMLGVSRDTVWRWQQWYRLHLRLESAKATADQVRLEFLKENPDADPEHAERAAQFAFTAETLQNGNVKAFVALAKLRLDQRKVAVDERRLRLLEERAREAKEKLTQAATAAKGGLTEETLKRIEEAAHLL